MVSDIFMFNPYIPDLGMMGPSDSYFSSGLNTPFVYIYIYILFGDSRSWLLFGVSCKEFHAVRAGPACCSTPHQVGLQCWLARHETLHGGAHKTGAFPLQKGAGWKPPEPPENLGRSTDGGAKRLGTRQGQQGQSETKRRKRRNTSRGRSR